MVNRGYKVEWETKWLPPLLAKDSDNWFLSFFRGVIRFFFKAEKKEKWERKKSNITLQKSPESMF